MKEREWRVDVLGSHLQMSRSSKYVAADCIALHARVCV